MTYFDRCYSGRVLNKNDPCFGKTYDQPVLDDGLLVLEFDEGCYECPYFAKKGDAENV